MTRLEVKGPRMTVTEQLSRNPANRGRPLAIEIKDKTTGRYLRAREVVTAGARGIGGVIESTARRGCDIFILETITTPFLPFHVMEGPITVEVFRQFVEGSEYEIAGNNANRLVSLLVDDTKSDHDLKYVSRNDASAFTAWYSRKTREAWIIPTEDQWLAAVNAVGDQLKGRFFEWTQTISGAGNILRNLKGDRIAHFPENRSSDCTLRLLLRK
ncbi:SUMF1/EgtB/PvdO family nonheme iron enzyme [Candidatus Saganbacteria bacterium]|nr:SUMF1/EgtB/PvdO family nonheme iron enzyme [Candidatus Saganbacteria bacterium]